jgi:poly-beta-1,6-N-acetyl-D-glucosamine synthase
MVKSHYTNPETIRITAIITSCNEPKTIGKAVKSMIHSLKTESYEIIVIAPDSKTLQAAKVMGLVKTIRDKKEGKPAALNIAFKKARGQIIILSDGDVYTKNAGLLLRRFDNPCVGAVSGRVISLSPRTTLLGYWSHLLTDSAHKRRLKRGFLDCTGYIYAIRNTISSIPKDALSDDAVISQMIHKYGYEIKYEPRALAFVKYPSTYSDWLKQKIRSAGGYLQIRKYFKNPRVMRNLSAEIFEGTLYALMYPRNIKEAWWTFLLFFARIHMWSLIYLNKKKSFKDIWKRVESTK